MDDTATRSDPSPPHLTHDELIAAQVETLATPRRRYGAAASLLFATLDFCYGSQRTLSKFKVLELVARVPYQAWEQAAYVAITHIHQRTGLARRVYDRIRESRAQQDNEQWHLLILDELIAEAGTQEGAVRFFWLPQVLAFLYYQASWLLYVVHPRWSYALNADFEDHAEHEYALLVQEHPEWETEPFESDLTREYGSFQSLADVFRQISHDERVHKLESIAWLSRPRFS